MMKEFVKDESGQGLAEYALILALVAIAVIGALTTLGSKANTKLDNVASSINSAGSGGAGA